MTIGLLGHKRSLCPFLNRGVDSGCIEKRRCLYSKRYLCVTGRGTCRIEVFPAPFAVFLDENGKNYVEPDISVICDKDKITEKGCAGAPDWIIEIVSPGSRQMDYFKKLFKYRIAGVREYWVVDSDKKCNSL